MARSMRGTRSGSSSRARVAKKKRNSRKTNSQVPRQKLGTWESWLVSQRIRSHLELHELAGGPFATFHVEWRPRGDGRVEALALPATVRIVYAAAQPFRVVAHGVRDGQRHELAVPQTQQSLGQVAGRQRHVLACAKRVEAIDEVIVRRIGAAVLHRSLVVRTREWIERPAFRTVLSRRGGRAVERALALAAIEAGEMSAREHRPDDAFAVDVQAARCVALH